MKTKWLIPAVAAACLVAAGLLFFRKPASAPAETLRRDADRNLVLSASGLSTDKVAFLPIGEGSKIELLARLNESGKAEIALGTCQSCNGSPYAYYTQEGNQLKCNNCGLLFPLDVLDIPGGGCHPIMVDASLITETADGLLIDAKGLAEYEPLFATVKR